MYVLTVQQLQLAPDLPSTTRQRLATRTQQQQDTRTTLAVVPIIIHAGTS
jgi:hypothetical protein